MTFVLGKPMNIAECIFFSFLSWIGASLVPAVDLNDMRKRYGRAASEDFQAQLGHCFRSFRDNAKKRSILDKFC
ncbi:hypothetical protein EDC04DRAFT_2676832 [Pisolithus marmoratus]|nr:hypothetical protein EDC04DRAFT_2676832 [Pisolithus marmoratus]